MKKLFFYFLTVILLAGCTEMTVDTDKISDQVGFSPAYVIAVSGDINLNDMIQPGDTILEPRDTILFDDAGLMKLFFYKDSIIDMSVNDFYDGFSESTFSGTYGIWPVQEEVIEESIEVDPGDDIKLKTMKVNSGEIYYTISSACDYPVSFLLILTSVFDETDNPIERTIPIEAGETVNGSISLDNTEVDFTWDGIQPYNRIRVSGLVTPGGITSDPIGSITLDVRVPEPDFDYITGYFGQQTEGVENDTISLDLGEIFGDNTDAFYLADPKVKINYINSFGLPLEVSTDVKGTRGSEEVDLDREAEVLLYPTSPGNREIQGSFLIDSSNSMLPELISMFADEIIFGGGATTNPLGEVGPDNLVFSDSRMLANLEVEIPMVFWMNNLVLADTIDNFFEADEDGESPLDFIDELEMNMYIKNGFPLGGEFSMILYDSTNQDNLSAIETGTFFGPAPVDGDGIVTAPEEKTTLITLTDDFIADGRGPDANKIIIRFEFYTTAGSAQAVKIMSDYSINFRAGVKLRPSFEN